MKEIVKDVYIVKPYDPSVIDCCVYLIDTKSDDGLVLIDAGINFEPIQNIEKDGLNIRDIKHCLITHGHIDHYGVCHRLKEFNPDIKFYAHELDAEKIEKKSTGPYPNRFYETYQYEPVKLFKKFDVEDEIIDIGGIKIKCIHIPGHSQGSMAYLIEKEGKRILFGGDLAGIAINIHDGNIDQYLKSLPKLLKLNIDILCEGHEHIIQPAEKVLKFLDGYMRFNKNLNLVVLENPTNTHAVYELALISYELDFYEMALDLCNYLLEIESGNEKGLRLLENIEKHEPGKIDFIKRLIKENFQEKE
ncbi:MAG: MBL fold metallo-hydrolase [Promethearchaeota archaeon]|jgi:glyoxylase-like metal-dependent hydrolase (beta-lactamase superfamily II)